MRHLGRTLNRRIDMVRQPEIRMVALISTFVFCSLIMGTILKLQAQEEHLPTKVASNLPQTQATEQDNSRRIDALERDMALAKYFMTIVRDGAIALGSVATLGLVGLGYLSWRRESRLQENYRQERKFYEIQVERRVYQEARLATQQLDMGALGLTKSTMFASQTKNIEALGHVLDVIARASNIRLEREEGHEKFESMLKSLRTGARGVMYRLKAKLIDFGM